MKKYLVLVLLIIFFGVSFAQQDSLLLQKFYYPNGVLSSKGNFYKHKPDGLWMNFFPNQQLKSQGYWQKGVLTGQWIFFNQKGDTTEIIHYRKGLKNGWNYQYQNNNIVLKQLFLNDKIIGISYVYKDDLIEEIPYKNGLKNGLALVYQNGRLINLIDYKNGYRFSERNVNRYRSNYKQGTWVDLYPNTSIHIERNYKNDTLNGFYREYAPNGTLLKNLYYSMGILDTTSQNAITSKIKQAFYDNGRLKSTGFYKNDKQVGLHQYFSPDGKITNAQLFTEDGILLGEGSLNDEGRRTGLWQFYYPDKSLKTKGYYKKGRRTKEWFFYFSNGQIEQKGHYKSGKFHNIWTHYDSDGRIIKTEQYKKGDLNGDYIQYNIENQIVIKGIYKNNIKDGHWQYIFSNITIDEFYDHGLKHGHFKSTYSNGQLAFKGQYIQGEPEGKHRYYYQNGMIKSYQFFINGSKEKIWFWYNEDGIEELSYHYRNNQIYKINGKKYQLDE